MLTLKNNKGVSQALMLLFSTCISMLMVLLSNAFLTKFLTPIAFGDFYYIINIYLFLQTLFNVGFPHTIGRLVALEDLSKEGYREYYGIGIKICLKLYLLQTLFLVIYIYIWEEKSMCPPLLLTVPFGWVFLLSYFNESYLQGVNDIKTLSLSRLLPKVLFTICVFFMFLLTEEKGLNTIVLLFYITFGISLLYIYNMNSPCFPLGQVKKTKVIFYNRKFGFPIYLGSIVSVGTGYLSGLLISFYGVDNATVGFYNIGLQFSAPLALLPNIVATVFFKIFVNSSKINPSLIVFTLCLSLLAFLGVYALIPFVIEHIYGVNYLPAVNITIILSFGSILYGLSDFFNRFLLAKGRGKELRNISMIIGGVLLVFNFLLVKYYGVYGATAAKVLTGLLYLLLILFSYNRLIKVIKHAK